jgi:hypothetical protein
MDAVLRLYIERVPEVGYEGSCIFHGKQGLYTGPVSAVRCVQRLLPWWASGLYAGDDTVTPTLIIAGVGEKMRTSPILMP